LTTIPGIGAIDLAA
jgi:hypothetical protein